MDDTMAAIQRFIDFWRRLPLEQGPYVHPDDANYVSAGPQGPKQLQLNVVPIPVNGCLRTADIVLLEANPNFDAEQEGAWAAHHPEGARQLELLRRRNLRQENVPDDCPFHDLDPRFAMTGGGVYWRSGRKFRDAAEELRKAWGLPLDDVYRELSWRVVVLQMLPYRSKKFGHERVAERCASGQAVRQLVTALANDPHKLVICQRRVEQWGFHFPSEIPTVITYDPRREALKALLSRNSRGGPAMIQKLASIGPQHI